MEIPTSLSVELYINFVQSIVSRPADQQSLSLSFLIHFRAVQTTLYSIRTDETMLMERLSNMNPTERSICSIKLPKYTRISSSDDYAGAVVVAAGASAGASGAGVFW